MKRLVFFTSIRKGVHYRLFHEASFPWHEVVEIVLASKCLRKKGVRYVIETRSTYVLLALEGTTLKVINAKRT